ATHVAQSEQRLSQKRVSDPGSSYRRGNADLCNVSALRRYHTGQRYAAYLARKSVQRHIRRRTEKCATARILHDVIQEPAGARSRTVLIVNPAVDVSGVGHRD